MVPAPDYVLSVNNRRLWDDAIMPSGYNAIAKRITGLFELVKAEFSDVFGAGVHAMGLQT